MCNQFTRPENSEDEHWVHYYGDDGFARYYVRCPNGPVSVDKVTLDRQERFDELLDQLGRCIAHVCKEEGDSHGVR